MLGENERDRAQPSSTPALLTHKSVRRALPLFCTICYIGSLCLATHRGDMGSGQVRSVEVGRTFVRSSSVLSSHQSITPHSGRASTGRKARLQRAYAVASPAASAAPEETTEAEVGPESERATVSNTRSISGALRVKLRRQKAYRGFFNSSMKVISRPHCGSGGRGRGKG